MGKNDLISIIMPTYNCSKFIGKSIESVLNQTYPKWELIIVDDHSDDDTPIIAKEFQNKDERIKYFRLEKNSGAACARTKAMEEARGNYMAFLDSDDLWAKTKLEKQICFMKKNNINISCTSYEKIDENGKLLNKAVKAIPKVGYDRLLLDCPVGNSTVMYNAEKLGKFSVPNIRKRNDDALWLQMLKKEPYIYGYPKVLVRYRIRKNSISENKLSLIKYHWQLYRDIEHLSVIRSIFHICFWVLIKLFKIK